MPKMKYLLKVLNPFIAVMNYFMYFSHLESCRFCENEPYDFSQDIKYF